LAYCIESNAIYLLILLKSDVVVLSEQKVLENRTVFYACSVELLVNMMFMVKNLGIFYYESAQHSKRPEISVRDWITWLKNVHYVNLSDSKWHKVV